MNTIKIFLAESGRIADLRKDFPLFQGQFNDKLLNIFVPTSILAPQFEIQHYIGQNTVSVLPTDSELDSFVAYNTPTHREPEEGDIVEIYDTSTSKFWLYVYTNNDWSSTEVDGFGSFSNVAGTSVKIGCYATKRNGEIYKSKSYFVRYLKTFTQNNVEYALYERKLPKEFTKFEGQGANAIKVVANVVNVDTQSNAVTSIVTSQSCALEVMPSSLLDQDETIEASDLERLEAQVNENTADIALKQDKTDATLNTTSKTVVGAINELNTQVATNTSNIASNTAELALKQNKQDNLLATTDKTVVGGINELNTQVGENTSNISNNTENITDLQERVSDLENTVITGETFIGSFSGNSLPTDVQLNAFVVAEAERQPKGGDYIYFTLEVAGETDVNYKYTYSNESGWSGAEIPGMETADNTTKGIVKGSYGSGNSPQTQISIVDGEFQEVYVVDTTDAENPTKRTLPSFLNSVKSQTQTNATNIQTNAGNIAQNTLDIQTNTNDIGTLNTNVGKIVDGTTSVGSAVKATNDGLNRNIAQTYLTQNAGATKQQLYDYALPRAFNDVSFLSSDNEYSDTIPSGSSALYTATSSSVGYTTLFYAEKTIENARFQLADKNSYTNTFFVTASANCNVSFRLLTQVYINGAWTTLNIELSDSINMVANEVKKISLGSTFNYLDDVINVADNDIIKQTLEVQTSTSSSIAFSIYSNETYPSTFYLNTSALVRVVQQGDLGELPYYDMVGTNDNGVLKFYLYGDINTNTYAHFKLTYQGSLPSGGTVEIIKQSTSQTLKLNTPYNYGNNDPVYITDLKQIYYKEVITTATFNTWEFNGFIRIEGGEIIVEIDIDNLKGIGPTNIQNGVTTGIEQTGNGIAKGSNSAAFNSGVARGTNAFAETAGIARGIHSHSEGEFSVANGWASHAEGGETIASHSCQHVEGIANEGKQLTMHEVGNGRFSFIPVSPKPTYSVACNFGADGNTYYFASIQGGGHHLITSKRYTEEEYNALDNVYTMQREGQNIFEVYQYGSLSNGVHVEDLKLFMLAFLAQTVSGGTITMEAAITQGYDYCVTAMAPYLDQLKGYLATLYPQAATLISSVTTVDELMTLLVTLIFGQNNITDNYVISPLSFLNGMNNKTYSLATLLSGYGNTIGATDDIVCGTASGALGVNNTVKGQNSLAVGDGNTIQRANSSVAFGNGNVVDSNSNSATIVNAFAIGNFLKNYYSRSLVIGYYNDDSAAGLTEKIFQVGNGTGDNDRSNAFEVLSDGTARVFGTPTGNYDVTNKNYVDTEINNKVSNVYKIQGSETVSNLNGLTKSESMNGYVYNISTGGTLNNQDASTLTVAAGDNVLFVWASGSWYWDKLAGDIDLTSYVPTSRTIAGIDLQDNITKSELQTALEIETLTGSSAPTTSTVGRVGQLYLDTINNNTYQCTAITAQGTTPETYTYTWVKLIRATDYATTALSGVVQLDTYCGIGNPSGATGGIGIIRATDSEIDAKTQGYHPIVPTNLNHAVKSALTATNHLTMTSVEQDTAQEVIGIQYGLLRLDE